ncbi:MAG: amino acid--[acyl-carrier-protein] ligase [Deltaproteobacteria bacterium]|nr:amino acid--[acyl-carrier-protein] ligase [Deltaproteobacteria bacterium]
MVLSINEHEAKLITVKKHELAAISPALFTPADAAGVYARTEVFEQIITALSDFITRYREPNTEVLRFPPVMSRHQLETSGYLQSFPHLLGVVSCIRGDESEIRNLVETPDWVSGLSATDLVLAPAACYPVYPMAAARRYLPGDGLLFDVACYCFRRESTHELDRLQAFRMREYVCIGTPEQVVDFRSRWMSRAESMARQLGLSYEIAPASDPFFGRVGRLAALSQLEQCLKFEFLIPVRSDEQPTACMSFNYHRDHFGLNWGLRTAAGATAHTGCVAFGLERLALALFVTHGVDLQNWPEAVRGNLLV